MKSYIRSILLVCVFAVTSAVFAQLPTANQVGLYAGKGTIVMNIDLDSPKLVKEPATFVISVQADGSFEMQIVFASGTPGMGMGDGFFGSAGAIYRVAIESVVATGRLTFKGSGAKLKASGTINMLLPGYLSLGEGTLKLKKVTL
jgi:hypothetical protein